MQYLLRPVLSVSMLTKMWNDFVKVLFTALCLYEFVEKMPM